MPFPDLCCEEELGIFDLTESDLDSFVSGRGPDDDGCHYPVGYEYEDVVRIYDEMTGPFDPTSVDYDARAELSENDIWDSHDDPRPDVLIWCSRDWERAILIAETIFREMHFSHQELKLTTEIGEKGVIILMETGGRKTKRDTVFAVLETITFEAIYEYAHHDASCDVVNSPHV